MFLRRSGPRWYETLHTERAFGPLWFRVLCGTIPFLVFGGVYLYFAGGDRAVPTFREMWDAIRMYAFEPDRNGVYRLWADTLVSVARFGIPLTLCFAGSFVGLYVGTFPFLGWTFRPIAIALGNVPAMALLVLLLKLLGTGEFGKIMLISMSMVPVIIMDADARARGVPEALKELTRGLGASTNEIPMRALYPMILPGVLETLRVTLRIGLVLLIAVEPIGGAAGLGYRIVLLKAHMNMAVIIPYVVWMTFLVFVLDFGLLLIIKSFKWYNK